MDPVTLHQQYSTQLAHLLEQLPDPGLRTAARGWNDPFFRQCALALWQIGGSLTPAHGDCYNALYSGPKPQDTLFWDLTAQAGELTALPAPPLFPRLLAYDRQTGHGTARRFLDTLASLLPLLAGAPGPITPAQQEAMQTYLNDLFAQWQRERLPGDAAPPALLLLPPASTSPSPPPLSSVPRTAPVDAAPAQEAQTPPEPTPTVEELLDQLDQLIGLEEVKRQVHSLINLVKVRRLREEAGLPVPPLSLHMVFVGNPGTGKTTVARLIAQLYKTIGVLSQGQLVEVDRSGLVAGYVGQTALKTQEVLQSALGGVLFLDEAYALAPADAPADYGREAIEVLLKGMEDHRKDLVVIVAGYPAPMERFLHSNPGLESRFNKSLLFEDYSPQQLLDIFRSLCAKNGYTLSPAAQETAAALFQTLWEGRDEHFGNAREVRNRFEDAVARQADRVALLPNPQREDLMALLPKDIL